MDIEKFVINIGRQLGSGGRIIGKQLAHDFGIAYFDKEILTMAAKESGICTEIFEKSDEHKGLFHTVFGGIFPFFGSGAGDFYNNQISDESLFRIQSEAIRKAAERESCVFIGRCADYVLRDNPRCVNIFISADLNDRVRRIMSYNHSTSTPPGRWQNEATRTVPTSTIFTVRARGVRPTPITSVSIPVCSVRPERSNSSSSSSA